MKVTLTHPRDAARLATYGVDPERGGACLDVLYDGVPLSWDAAELGGDHDDPILGVLRVLTMFGFLAGHDIDDALAWLHVSHGGNFLAEPPPGWPGRRRPRRGVRRVLRVVRELGLLAA